MNKFVLSAMVLLCTIANATTKNVSIFDFKELKNTKNIEIHDVRELNMMSFGTLKDTRMLITTFGEMSEEWGWNKKTSEGFKSSTGRSDSRLQIMENCGPIAVFNTYNYFYGYQNLIGGGKALKKNAMKQDEIMYYGHKLSGNQNFSLGKKYSYSSLDTYLKKGAKELIKSGEVPRNNLVENMYQLYSNKYGQGEIVALLRWLFNDKVSVSAYNADNMPSDKGKLVRNNVDKGIPVIMEFQTIRGHYAVIDGYGLDKNGKLVVHIVNIDNYGSTSYSYFDELSIGQLIHVNSVPSSSDARLTNDQYPVNSSSDKDAICDFDEFYRFGTDPKKEDSDGDGISDYDEIRGYVLRTNLDFGNGTKPTSRPLTSSKKEFGPEMKKDFDGDELNDNQEDLNKDGLFQPENGERDALNSGTGFVTDDVPGNFTLYARHFLAMYDNTKCSNGKSGCNVASELHGNTYSVRLGSGSLLGVVRTQGGGDDDAECFS